MNGRLCESIVRPNTIASANIFNMKQSHQISYVNYSRIMMHMYHDDVIKWKPFLRYWPFVRGIHRSPMDSPHKGQWRGALMFSLICAWTNGWTNNRDDGDLIRHHTHYDVNVTCHRISSSADFVMACRLLDPKNHCRIIIKAPILYASIRIPSKEKVMDGDITISE